MTVTDPYKEIHTLREKIAQLYDEYAGKPCEQIRHMEEVAELREENQKLREALKEEIEQLKQERSEMCSIIDGSIKEINRYRKALEEIRKSAEYPDSPMEHQIYEIAQRVLDDE